MKTTLSPGNPFIDRPTWAYAYESIPDGGRVLDYGCYDGEFIDRLAAAKRVTVVGADKNKDVLASYKGPHQVIHVENRGIPVEGATFDVVTMFDVLEHVHDQHALLRDVHRVLKPGGTLFVTVPRKHIFSFLDLSNLKYIFPKTHKFFYTLVRSREAYDYRYANNPYGLIGDVEKEKAWHQHFREDELVGLLNRANFKTEHIDGYGRYGYLMTFFSTLGLRIIPERLRRWDNYSFETREFACRFSKAAEADASRPAAVV